MQAKNLIQLLNKFERNFQNAYVTWYENDLPPELEPQYDPTWILEGSPEINWHTSRQFTNREKFVMVDGSVLSVDSRGHWNAYMYPTTNRST